MIYGTAIGVALGAGIGLAFNDMAIGAGVGLALGPAIGMTFGTKKD